MKARFLRWLFVCSLVAPPAFAPWALPNPDVGPCLLGYLVINPGDFTIVELKDRYQAVRKRLPKVIPEIDGLRLVNIRDWFNQGIRPGHLAYGPVTFGAWEKAAQFVMDYPKDGPIDAALLKQIHRIATEGHYFRGYERRRIEAALAQGRIDAKEAKRLNDAIEAGAVVNFSGNPEGAFRGKFREDPLDPLVHNGDHFTEGGHRFFYDHELAMYRTNPYLKIDESSLKSIGGGRMLGSVHYPEPKEVSAVVDKVFTDLNRQLKDANDDIARIKAINEFQRHMMTIHPFLDGNGRSIRLMSELLYERYGLPPPLRFHESELEIPPLADARFTLREMEMYVKSLEAVPRR